MFHRVFERALEAVGDHPGAGELWRKCVAFEEAQVSNEQQAFFAGFFAISRERGRVLTCSNIDVYLGKLFAVLELLSYYCCVCFCSQCIFNLLIWKFSELYIVFSDWTFCDGRSVVRSVALPLVKSCFLVVIVFSCHGQKRKGTSTKCFWWRRPFWYGASAKGDRRRTVGVSFFFHVFSRTTFVLSVSCLCFVVCAKIVWLAPIAKASVSGRYQYDSVVSRLSISYYIMKHNSNIIVWCVCVCVSVFFFFFFCGFCFWSSFFFVYNAKDRICGSTAGRMFCVFRSLADKIVFKITIKQWRGVQGGATGLQGAWDSLYSHVTFRSTRVLSVFACVFFMRFDSCLFFVLYRAVSYGTTSIMFIVGASPVIATRVLKVSECPPSLCCCSVVLSLMIGASLRALCSCFEHTCGRRDMAMLAFDKDEREKE